MIEQEHLERLEETLQTMTQEADPAICALEAGELDDTEVTKIVNDILTRAGVPHQLTTSHKNAMHCPAATKHTRLTYDDRLVRRFVSSHLGN